MSDCCPPAQSKKKLDVLLWGSVALVAAGFCIHFFGPASAPDALQTYGHATVELMKKMWLGLVLGILVVGLLTGIPRDFVVAILGKPGSTQGILRATAAGLLLDLCSHGILLVGLKLYERGASLGQMMAFLIASPWNSLSLTIILISLIGPMYTLIFIVGSAIIAIVSGLLFDRLVRHEILPPNENQQAIPEDFSFWRQAKQGLKQTQFNASFFKNVAIEGLRDSRMILRWIFFGVVAASAIRAFVPVDTFAQWFGPSIGGLALTLVFATIIEVCSEGSTPIAADLVTRAGAVGNGFTFLMAGVSTDYTEIMGIKERTGSWKIALFLPLVTLPQVVLVGWLLNHLYS
jgi:uncharacterized membrane protein YraQ (UPF0718 family)